jgi:mono/diheme cytochrome c family protein
MASAGKGGACYHKYGCNSCHGANGVGLADLRNAKRDYPKDADLVAWIRDAPSKKPGTRMPKWDGVIAEGDYPELVAFVRSLAP